MSECEPLAVASRPAARARAGMTSEPTAVDTPDGPRRGTTNCGFCGQAWFGEVAYCPYCGHRAAGTPAGTDAQAQAAPATQAVAPAHAGGPQREGAPQGADDPAPASQASVPPA